MRGSHGRTVNFKNTVVIMTSNLGGSLILDAHLATERDYERMRDQVLELVRPHFPPEFLNRVDEIVVFRPFTETQIRQIVEIQLDRLQARLAERHLMFTCTDAAKAYLARVGYDPAFAARPLKRAMQRELETPPARRIVAGEVRDGMRVRVDVVSDGLVFKATKATATGA